MNGINFNGICLIKVKCEIIEMIIKVGGLISEFMIGLDFNVSGLIYLLKC